MLNMNKYNVFSQGRQSIIHFLVLMFIGSSSIFCMSIISDTKVGEAIVNKVYDEIIKRYAIASIINSKLVTSNKVAYVDIDQKTHNEWGNPLFTPRDKLSDILETAYNRGAKVILLDVCIDSNSDKSSELSLLYKTIETLSHKYKNTYLILQKRAINNKPIKSDLDIIVNNSRNIFYADPSFYLSSTDNVVRYWTPVVKYADSTTVYNTSLLAVALLENDGRINKNDNVKYKSQSLVESKHTLNYKVEVKYRIHFYDIPSNTISDYDGGNLFTNKLSIKELNKSNFNNKLVIIGNSSELLGDNHSTPVGTMPGMYVLGNIANTILNGKTTGNYINNIDMLINMFLIFATSYVIMMIKKNYQQFIFNVIWFLASIEISSYMYINFDMMIIAPIGILMIGTYEGISDFEHFIYKKLERKAAL